MTSNSTFTSDVIFEVSWEVCNKVGGIYTVLSSKYTSANQNLGDHYIFIGPDVWKETRENPDFIEDKNLYSAWVKNAEREGLRIRVGRWNIPGKPVAVLVDFTPFFTQKDKIFATLWESYQLDSISGGWDYIEPALFGYAAGKVVESFHDFYLSVDDNIIAHFHEWMTGAGILYLKKEAPQVGTVFTTHATTLGRSITGNNLPLYSQLEGINPVEKARKIGVVAKQSLEYCAAQHCDSFTTVSSITALECKQFLGREPIPITPNGFSNSFVPEALSKTRKDARKKIIQATEAILNQKIDQNAFMIMTSGRYEFRNKGLDVFIDALAMLNDRIDKRQVVAIIAIPGNHIGPRKEVLDRLAKPNFSNPITGEYLSHTLFDRYHDQVINRLTEKGLLNSPENKVKIIFAPVYFDGKDGIFNLIYYDFLAGFDLTIFPSFYEPWGYTPMESIAFGVPTITTTLAGFGAWVKDYIKTPALTISVVERNETDESNCVKEITDVIEKTYLLDATKVTQLKKETQLLIDNFLWEKLIDRYFEAYDEALQAAAIRSELIERKVSLEITFKDHDKQEKPSWKKFYVRSEIHRDLEPLKELSMNLWWTWNYEASDLFESIDPNLWESLEHNPVAMLNYLSYEKFQALRSDKQFMEQLKIVYASFMEYMAIKADPKLGKVAYFSMEYGLHESVKIYSGGLGILAGDYLKEASDSNKNLIAIGLMYRFGYFNQILTIFGDQIAESHPQKYTDLPLHPVRSGSGEWLIITVVLPGRTLFAKVWKLLIGRIELYLLDTDLEENSMEDRTITHHLYGGDWHNRFKQELLLGVGGVRLLQKLQIKPDIFHLNEGHAAFAGLERLRVLVEDKGLSFNSAFEVVRSSSLFTTHTPVPAGHDTFEEDILRMYIPHYANRLHISWEEFMDLGKYTSGSPTEKFSMSVLAARLSQEMNGVSKIHGRVSREMFAKLYPGYFAEELHIGHVTNGVHFSTWASKNWQQFYQSKFGQNYIADQTDSELWKKVFTLSDAVVWKQRQKARKGFLEFLRTKLSSDLNRRQENPRLIYNTLEGIDENALYIGFARRFATYKRARLIFTNLDKLAAMVNNSERPLRFVFAGKAHPNDHPGQDLIKSIIEISKMPQFVGKIFFLENYDMSVGRQLVSGVDIWLNTPTRPLEASGTSGEKAVMNGVLNFSVLDGWWAEGYTENAGWAIPEAKTYGNQAFQDELDAEIIYRQLEDEILPIFFDRDKQGVSNKWVSFIKKNLAEIAPRFVMRRMLNDYYNEFYQPLFERSELISKNNYQLANDIEEFKNHIRNNWDGIEVKSVRLPDSSLKPLKLGDEFTVEVDMETNGIKPENIGIDIVLGQKELDRLTKIYQRDVLQLLSVKNNIATYGCKIAINDSGVFDFAFRIFPASEFLVHRQDFYLVKWI